MHKETGRIYTEEEAAQLPPEEQEMLQMMEVQPTHIQMYRRPYPKVSRNELCPCGSGKKFKRCCLVKEE